MEEKSAETKAFHDKFGDGSRDWSIELIGLTGDVAAVLEDETALLKGQDVISFREVQSHLIALARFGFQRQEGRKPPVIHLHARCHCYFTNMETREGGSRELTVSIKRYDGQVVSLVRPPKAALQARDSTS